MLENKLELKKTQAMIDGNVVAYDACFEAEENTLLEATEFYQYKHGWRYIGTGRIYSIGHAIVKNNNKLYYFFTKNSSKC